MPVPVDELLKRFDVVFRTILVVASITISAALALYKDILPPYAFIYSISFFLAAICIWAYSTMKGGTAECMLKIVAWWTLMTAFALLVARLIFSSFLLPPLVTTFAVAIGLILTWPLFDYFRQMITDNQERHVKKLFKVGLMVVLFVETIYLIVVLILLFV